MDKKKPHKGKGHRQRLRDRFLSAGLDGFQDYEVIELLLTLGTPRKDCKDMAKAALLRFKTLQGVMEASTRELCEVDGIGPKNSFGLKLIKAVSDRYLEKKLIRKRPVNNSKELFDYLYHSIRDKGREHFKIIFLDSKNRVISIETHSKGTLTGPSQPKTRRDISRPVSYDPPLTAWSLPAGSHVVFITYHFAGQSTLRDIFTLILSSLAVSE